MAKMPFFLFYPHDWLYDTRILNDEEKSTWIDLLCFMWNAPERGRISAHPEDLARMVGREWKPFSIILDGLKNKLVADVVRDVTNDHNVVTVISRRMVREEKARESDVIRKRRQREKESHADVTDNKSEAKKSYKDMVDVPPPAPANEESFKPPKRRKASGEDPFFALFWSAYPKKKAKVDALRAWQRLAPDSELRETILRALQVQSKQKDWTKENGEFVPLPASWLNGRRWEDDVKAPFGKPEATPQEKAAAEARYQAMLQREQEKAEARLAKK